MNTKKSFGFAMPIVVIITTVMMIVLLALLQTVTSFRSFSLTQYYSKLAEEAAEAGVQYASACLEANNHIQTWGNNDSPLNKLTQSSDCTGDQTKFPGNSVVASDARVKTTFTVGNLDTSNTNSVQISAKGQTDFKSSSGTVISSYTSIIKKSIVWASDLNLTSSVSGTNRTCAIVGGSVYCWGYNAYGQLGDGRYLGTGSIESASSIDSLVPVKVKKELGKLAGKTVTNIFVAQYHSCALTSDGKVYCWGQNAYGQLGNGTTTSNGTAVEVGGLLTGKTVTAIGGTGNTSCAIAAGKIYCWGSNALGAVGINLSSSNNYSVPQAVVAGNTATTLPTSYNATALSTSGSRSFNMCAVADGKAYCWGANNVGQIGDGTTTQRNLPTKVVDTGVLSGKTVTSLSQDGYNNGNGTNIYPHVCAIASGSVYCWGANNSGQLGNGTTTASSSPVAVITTGVLSGKTIDEVAVGLQHSCVRAAGEAFCWGDNASGQVGDNTSPDRTSPVSVYKEAGALLGATVARIGAGANRGCAVVTTGKSYCWGLNSSGQIGDGTNVSPRRKPTESLFLRPDNNEYIY